MAEFWSNNDRGYRIRMRIDQVSQDIQSNTSRVHIQLALLNQGWTFASYQCSGYVDGAGQRLNYSGQPSMTNRNSEIQLIDQHITVNHNPDGSGGFGIHAHFNGSGGYSPGNLDIGQQAIALTTIPRGSSVSVPEGYIGGQVDIKIDRKIAGAKHTLRYTWGDKTGKIADNVDTSYRWTIPSDFANDIPNASSGVGTIYVDTYVNGKMIQTQQTGFTAKLVTANVKPTFSGFKLSDANGPTQNLISNSNYFVSALSEIKVTFDGAKGNNGSQITGYYAELVGENRSTSTNGGTLTSVVVQKDKQITLRGRVQDSRGIWSDWKETKITILAYFSPTLRFEAIRGGSDKATLSIKRWIKVAPLIVEGKQKNVTKLSFRLRRVGSTDYKVDNGSAGGEWANISSIDGKEANLGNKYPADQSFEIIGRLEDKFSYSEFQVTAPTDSVVMSYDRKGIGILKYRENGALDVNGLIYARSHEIQHQKMTEANGDAITLSTQSNINDYRTTGIFNALATMKNYPIAKPEDGEGSGSLVVLNGIFGTSQTLTTMSGRTFKRTITANAVTKWIEYQQKLPDEPVTSIRFGIGYNVFVNAVRKGNLVTVSIEDHVGGVGNGERMVLAETIPEGYRPALEVALLANKNVSQRFFEMAVWYFEPDGSMKLTNNLLDDARWSGTVTYITNDSYPTDKDK